MSGRWAVRLGGADAAAVGSLRLVPGLEVLERPDALWLRGEGLDETLEQALRRLPGAERYDVLADGGLRAIGHRVPRGRLPEGEWMAVRAWARLEVQAGALAGRLERSATLRIVRADRMREANVLVLPWSVWAPWAIGAPAARLRPLDFAAARDGRTVVRGGPLPPLPGARWVEQSGMAVPCGYEWQPAVEPAVLAAWLGVSAGDLALLDTGGSVEVIPASGFVQARRSAVRATVEEGPRG